MLSDDDKESYTGKGVNIAMEVREYEDTLLNKEQMRHKMKRIQSKKKNWYIWSQQNIIIMFSW